MSQLQTKQNKITHLANFIDYITVNFHYFNIGMIPTRKKQEYKSRKYVDRVRSQDFPLTYNYLLITSYLAMHPSVLFICCNKTTQKRFCLFCYLTIQNVTNWNYECKLDWHSVAHVPHIYVKCYGCREDLISPRCKASDCLEYIEQFLKSKISM